MCIRDRSTDSSFTQDVNQIQSNVPSISNLNFSADTTYYWRIKSQNDCGESAFSPVLSFTTTPIQCLTYSSENLPKPLQDALGFLNGITTAEVFIGNTNTINDLNVWVNLSHTFLKDLTLQLIAPDETVVDLVSDCLLYTSDAADDLTRVDLGGRRIIKKKKTPHPPPPPPDAPPPSLFFFFFSSRRRHTRFLYVSWARRCV